MDVERLMKDLTVEQLQNIQGNLQTEMEGKKEELRDMVGRRYRDVLEASTEVRHVRQLAEKLAELVGHARATQGGVDTRPAPRGQQVTIQRFIALHRLLPLIGEDDGDAVSDVFALLLAENLHKELSSEHTTAAMHTVVTGLTARLVRTRRTLLADLEAELGELSQPDWAANQLTALAMLRDCDVDQLLDVYLEARKMYIGNQVDESSSLLSIVGELKATLAVVDELFAQGGLLRVLQATGVAGYRPGLIDNLIGDQAFSFSKMMSEEIERVNKVQRERKHGQLLTQRINDKCNMWIDQVCALAHPSVLTICDFYEKADDVIEFLHALSGILRENWPRISTNSSLYQKLFKNVVIDKFKALIVRDVSQLETDVVDRLPTISTAPHPMFEKRAGQFDSLLGVGIAGELRNCIFSFYQRVHQIRDCCLRYEKAGMEVQLEAIRETLAEAVAEAIGRLAARNCTSCEAEVCLARCRLCLALIHCDPTTVCQALNKDGDRISRTNRVLHEASEDALCRFSFSLADDCLSESKLRDFIDAYGQPVMALALATEWEKVDLPEVGLVEVPMSLSPPLHAALFALCRRLGDESVAHLLSRPVRKRLAVEIASRLSTILDATLLHANTVQRGWIQLLFDCRLLNAMFPHENLKKSISVIETHIDPFDLSLLSTLLTTNIRLATQRSQLLYSCILVDVLPNKDSQPSKTYSQVVDIVPRTEHPQRVSLIPRLDRNPVEEASKRIQAAKAPKNKLLATPQAGGSKNSASLSSLYDKMSSSFSFFGNG